MTPVWNIQAECYELSMFGQATESSTKNFILKDKDGEVALIHGKSSHQVYNVHYMPAFSRYMAFGISLISMIKKSYS